MLSPERIKEMQRKLRLSAQRSKRGYSDEDVWSFDRYLATIISGGVSRLKNGNGIPSEIMHRYPKNTDAMNAKIWNNVLDDIACTFETAIKIIDADLIYVSRDRESERKRLALSTRQVAKKCHDKIRIMSVAECRAFERGFDLFKEYFFSLWD